MKKFKIAVLGGGNIGTSLAKGLIVSKQYTYDEILITEKREPRITHLKNLGFHVTNNNHEAVKSFRNNCNVGKTSAIWDPDRRNKK